VSVREHISGTAGPNFAKFFLCVCLSCGRGTDHAVIGREAYFITKAEIDVYRGRRKTEGLEKAPTL